MSLFVRFTRWADFFFGKTALADIEERAAEADVKRLENLFLLSHRPNKPQSGELSMIKSEMDSDPEIVAAREALRISYNRRKLFSIMAEHQERDAAVCSRELSRRIGASDINRRADRHTP